MADAILDRLNRLIVVLAALLALAGAVVIVLVAIEAADPDFLPNAWFQPQLQGIRDFDGGALATTLLISLAVGAVMLYLIYNELKPKERHGRPLTISNSPDGDLTIDEDSVRYLAEKTGAANRQVSFMDCRVRSYGNGRRGHVPTVVAIDCYPKVAFGANLQEVRDDLQFRIRDTVEKLTGLTVASVTVDRVRYQRGDGSRLVPD
ncbi:MAG: Asp23/Gls24 family envelope stress response protein [SAR202 cluster bacterium]|nr:Asp23/Gls24 family envelope stress response protein [SAR202 cluster bacterium]